MDELSKKLNTYFQGRVVRKDLTKKIKEGANIPIYVLEYLIGMYCATYDKDSINDGVERVLLYYLFGSWIHGIFLSGNFFSNTIDFCRYNRFYII